MIDGSFCPFFQEAVELVGRRWCGAITRALLARPLRFAELERALPGVSARMLTLRLRELERAGVVVRRVDSSSPVRVTYALTEKGRALERVVREVERWAHDWLAPAGHVHTAAR